MLSPTDILGKNGLLAQRVADFAPREVQQQLAEAVARALGLREDQLKAELLKGFPSGRLSTVGEVAEAVIFFCGPGSDNVTGQVLRVDGGWRM